MWILPRMSRSVLAGTLVVALFWGGCGPRTLNSMKDAHQAGRYGEVAAMDVSCAPEDDRCNQMHLLKGDACYILGRRAEGESRDSTARARFECAETHLGAGIRQTEAARSGEWEIAGSERPQWYLNRAESLRQLQDLLSGDTARTVSNRLLEFGRMYREAVPGAAAPHFYVATARYALLQPKLIDVSSGDPSVCEELNAIQTVLDEAPADEVSDAIQDNVESLHDQLERQRERADCSS